MNNLLHDKRICVHEKKVQIIKINKKYKIKK